MESDLKVLDEKLQQLVVLTKKLRKDNSQLRQQLAAAESENKRLAEKVSAARTRVEALIEQIPESAE
jgi:cell division protein ZapB